MSSSNSSSTFEKYVNIFVSIGAAVVIFWCLGKNPP